jgi:hypothetical protein
MKFSRFQAPALFGLALLALSAVALGQQPSAAADAAAPHPIAEREVAAYCDYVQAVATSQSALLLAPSILLGYSNLPAGAVEPTAGAEDVGTTSRSRLQAGLVFSPTRMYRGIVTNRLGRAECDRYTAASRTQPVRPDVVIGRAALEAKIRILNEAVRKGRELTAALAKKLAESLATVEDYGALALQVDGLEGHLAQAELELAELPPVAVATAGNHVESLQVASARVEDLKGSLRRSEAFEIDLRGGYYRVLGVSTTAPYFVMASIQFNPGWFWQAPAEAKARQAVSSWVGARSAPRGLSADERGQLEQRLALARSRAVQLSATLNELSRHHEDIKAVPGEQAARYANVLWLQLAALRAERAFVEATATEIVQALHREPKLAP